MNSFKPKPSDIAWTRQHIGMIKSGGVWIVPRSGACYRFDHEAKTATVVTLPENCINVTLEACGYKVIL